MRFLIIILVMCSPTSNASSDMQAINRFLIDYTEISIAEFHFASATEFVSQAERASGGEVYAWGWE